MDLTPKQSRFLTDLRKGACRATAAQDATVIGPLIRTNLVRLDDDPMEVAGHRLRGSTFTLTTLGEAALARYETRPLPWHNMINE